MIEKVSAGIKYKLIALVTLSAGLILIWIVSDYPTFVERFYSEGLYVGICYLIRPVFGLFPFSAGDIIYIVLVAYLIYGLFNLMKNAFRRHYKRCLNILLTFIVGLQAAILIFYLFWGLNYYRPAALTLLKLKKYDFTTAELTTVTTLLIDSANKLRSVLPAADFFRSNDSIYKISVMAVKNLSSKSALFSIYRPFVKPSLITPLLNYLSTSGYYNPFTEEAQMNYRMPVFNRPVTACHEMAHQIGFATEDEANFIGFEAGIRSSDNLLRYSSYQMAVGEFMHALYLKDSLANKALKLKISAAVHQDFKTEQSYWKSYDSRVSWLSGIIYNNYLKVNNQPKGLETYNDMVLLVMALYKKGHSIYL